MTVRITARKGPPTTDFYLHADRLAATPASKAGNYSVVRMYVQAINRGSGGSSGYAFTHRGEIDGVGGGQYAAGTLPVVGVNVQRWYQHIGDFNVPHNADGTRGAVTLRMKNLTSDSDLSGEWTKSWSDFPTIVNVPDAPTDVDATWVSDAQATVTWTRNSSGNKQWQGVHIERWSASTGTWQRIASTITGVVTSYSDTTITANGRYKYRVVSYNSEGATTSVESGSVFTTPAAPTGVAAVRDGLDILVSAASVPPHATAFDVEDAGSIVATDVTLPWRDEAPNPALPHTYKLRGTVDGVLGVFSEPSNTVQLIAKPNAPTNLSPNGGVIASDGTQRLAFKHNPVDSSEQTSSQVRRRPVGGSWSNRVAVDTSDQFVDVDPATFFGAPGDYEWQARTKGAHVDWSDWSATATVTVISRPGVVVTAPSGSWGASIITTEWSWYQEQSRPQSAWEIELYDSEEVRVDRVTGQGATGVAVFGRRVTPGSWTVKAHAATGTVWSPWAIETFEVEFLPPPLPTITGGWVEAAGGVMLTFAAGVPDEEQPDTVKLELERSINDGESWEPIVTQESPEEITVPDWESRSRGETLYRLTAYTDEGATEIVVLPVLADSDGVWLSGGNGFEQTMRLPYNPDVGVDPGLERDLKIYAGRTKYVPYSGELEHVAWQVAGAITDHETDGTVTATVDDVIRFALLKGPVFQLRDPNGRRTYGQISRMPSRRKKAFFDEGGRNAVWEYSFTFTETERS